MTWFVAQRSTNFVYKLMVSVLGGMGSDAQSIQNKNFSKSFQYLKRDVRDEIIYCADRYQSFQQVGAIIFDELGQACLKFSK